MKLAVDHLENELFSDPESGLDLPEMRLWRAVFLIGIEDWRAGKLQAARWVDSDEDGIGSFVWLCEQLGHDALKIRGRMKHLKDDIQFAGIAVTRLCREW